MSNVDPELTLHASVDDAMTAPIERIATAVEFLAAQAEKAGNKSTVAATRLGLFGRAAERLKANLGGLDSRLMSVSRRMDQELGQATRRLAVGIGIAGAAVVGFGLRSASNFQATKISFETLLQSVEKGDALFKQLQALNISTPFQLKDLASSEQLLLRYNIQGERSVGILKGLADVAALSDDPAGNLDRMARAVGQIFTTGNLKGQDALQLVQAGINAYDVYAQKLGITQAAARKLGEEGKLNANILLDAITNLDGPLEKFRGGAQKMSQTLMGQLSNVKDALNIGLADAATPLVSQLATLIGTPDKPGVLLSGLTSLLSTVGPPLFSFVGALADLFAKALPAAAPILSAIADGLGRLLGAAGPALASLEPLGGKIGDSLIALVDALVPVMPDLVKLFGAFVLLLPEMVRLLADLVPIVPPIAKLLTLILSFGPARPIFAGLLVGLLAYSKLVPVIKTMWAFVAALKAIAAAETIAGVGKAAGLAPAVVAGAEAAGGGAAASAARGGLLAAAGRGIATAGGAVASRVPLSAVAGGAGALALAGGALYLADRNKKRAERHAASPEGQAEIAKQTAELNRPRRAPRGLPYDWRENPYFTEGPNGEARGGKKAAPGKSRVRRAAGMSAAGTKAAMPAASSGGSSGRALVEVNGNVYGMEDLEAFVRDARRKQDAEDTARDRRPQGASR